MSKWIAVYLFCFLLLPAIALGTQETPEDEMVLVNIYVLGDVGSGVPGWGGGFWVSNNALVGLEIDAVPVDGHYREFVGLSTQSPAFFMLMPRPVLAIGIFDGNAGWRIGIEAGIFVPYGKDGLVVPFAGLSWWGNIDGSRAVTFSIGFGF